MNRSACAGADAASIGGEVTEVGFAEFLRDLFALLAAE
jgi:hypothetical protein